MGYILPQLQQPDTVTVGEREIDRAIKVVRGAVLDLIAHVENLKRTPTWTPVPAAAMKNAWVPFSAAPDYVPSYWKDPWGRVFMRGLIATGTINTPAFTLPVGYRPPTQHSFVTKSGTATNNGTLTINVNGDVVPEVGSNTYFGLWCSFWTV